MEGSPPIENPLGARLAGSQGDLPSQSGFLLDGTDALELN
jgi:hypothetical protein